MWIAGEQLVGALAGKRDLEAGVAHRARQHVFADEVAVHREPLAVRDCGRPVLGDGRSVELDDSQRNAELARRRRGDRGLVVHADAELADAVVGPRAYACGDTGESDRERCADPTCTRGDRGDR